MNLLPLTLIRFCKENIVGTHTLLQCWQGCCTHISTARGFAPWTPLGSHAPPLITPPPLTGSESDRCNQLGGQCFCKENIIGRQCDRCKAGYFGFPDCRGELVILFQLGILSFLAPFFTHFTNSQRNFNCHSTKSLVKTEKLEKCIKLDSNGRFPQCVPGPIARWQAVVSALFVTRPAGTVNVLPMSSVRHIFIRFSAFANPSFFSGSRRITDLPFESRWRSEDMQPSSEDMQPSYSNN